MIEPIVKTVTVPLPSKKAFELFTTGIEDWWPAATYSLSAQTGARPRSIDVPDVPGEQVLETLPDGSRKPWGRVTEYDPGKLFAMSWHVGRDEACSSHLSVVFDAVPEGTRVTLTHNGWEALGETASAARDSYDTGWDGVLLREFAQACGKLAVIA